MDRSWGARNYIADGDKSNIASGETSLLVSRRIVDDESHGSL